MVQSGSNPARAFSLLGSLVVTVIGIAAMLTTGWPAVARPLFAALGFRGFLAVSEALLPLPALVSLAWSRTSPARALAIVRLPAGAVATCLGLGATLWIASLGLLELQYAVWPPGPEYIEGFRRIHEWLKPSGPLDALVSLVAIAVLPAICEETAVRGVLLPALRTAVGPPFAIVLSAAVFAFIHLDPYRTLFTFSVGLVLGALRLRAGSLLASVLAHAGLNALTFAAVPFLDDPAQPLPDPRPLLGLGLLAAGAMATAFLWRRLPSER